MKYTEKLHAYRLKLMLKRDNICDCCPAAEGFRNDRQPTYNWTGYDACEICDSFILRAKDIAVPSNTDGFCPCFMYENPTEMTLLALERYYKEMEDSC